MENDEKRIKRAFALREMEVREDQYGRPVFFSVEFYTSKGEVVHYSRAYLCGLRANMKEARVRGVQQCDTAGNKIGHPVTVSIDNIRLFNGQKVVI